MAPEWACNHPLGWQQIKPIGQEIFRRDLNAANERIEYYKKELGANHARPSTKEWLALVGTLQTKIQRSKYGLDTHTVRGLGSVVDAPSSYSNDDDRRAIRNEWINPAEAEQRRQEDNAREQQKLLMDPYWRLRKRRNLLYAWTTRMLLTRIIPKEVPNELDIAPVPEETGEDQVEVYWTKAKQFILDFNAPNAVDIIIIQHFKQQLALDQYLVNELKKNLILE